MKTKNAPMPDRGYMEFGRWTGTGYGLNMGIIAGNVIRNSRHWMYGPEIICMLRGSHTVWVDGVEYRLNCGDVLTVDTFRSHEIYDGAPGGLQLIFNFDEALMRRSGNVDLCLSTVGEYALPKDHPDVCALRDCVAQLACLQFGKDGYWARKGDMTDAQWFEVRMHLDHILMLLARHEQPSKKTQPESPMLLANCIREIHERYNEPLTLAVLSEKFNYSESSLYRIFRQSLGASFLDYLTSVRLNIACGMLQKNENTVMEISDLCGFSTYSNFYRIFKQRMGISPTEYQQKLESSSSMHWATSDSPLYRYNQFENFPVLPGDNYDDLVRVVQNCYP